jgi:hypothetical protein
MLLPTASGVRPIVSFLIVAVVYWLSLWRIIKGNRGNRVIECGGITLMLLFLMMLLMKLSNVPDWVLPSRRVKKVVRRLNYAEQHCYGFRVAPE